MELEDWATRLREKSFECRRLAENASLEWSAELQSIADECDREAAQIELLLSVPAEGSC